MKKVLLFNFMLIILSVNCFALVGFGGHIGFDLMSESAIEKEFSINIANTDYSYSIQRDAIENPVAFGGQVYLDLPAVPIGFELGIGAALQQYSWKADTQLVYGNETIDIDIPGFETEDGQYKEDFYFARVSADATAKYYFFKLPMLKTYVGAGAGMYFITPLISEELFVQNLENPTMPEGPMEIDVEELVKNETNFGYHGVLGLRLKPWVVPLSINLDYKYTMTPENDYKDETNKFGTIKASVNLYF